LPSRWGKTVYHLHAAPQQSHLFGTDGTGGGRAEGGRTGLGGSAENPADGNLFEPVLVEGGIAPPQRRPGRRDGSVHGRGTYRPHQQGIRQFVRFVDGFG